MKNTKQKPSIFLSHTHSDKPFAHRLANDLSEAGAQVWIDDAEILIGDSLIQKIRSGIDEMDYLAVILSPESVASEWVNKEIDIAMNQEIDGIRVKVLPLYYKECNIPGFLKGKHYADFSSEMLYSSSLKALLTRLDLKDADKGHEKYDEDKLKNLLNTHQLLNAAFTEAIEKGVSSATASAILSSSIPPTDIAEFWRLIAIHVTDWSLFGVARYVLNVIDKFNVGHEVIEYCISDERLSSEQIEQIGMLMQYVSNEDTVVWCHIQLTKRIMTDVYYNSFLQKHISVITNKCYDDMSAYLLLPNRGPAKYNVDTFADVIRHVSNPEPFVIRWIDWIHAGRFDGNGEPEDESAEILYKIFNKFIEKPIASFEPIIMTTLDRVYLLCKEKNSVHKGFYHLVSMLNAKYKNVSYVLYNIIPRIYPSQIPIEAKELYYLLEPSFRALSALNRDPENQFLEDAFRDKWLEVASVDKITGVWRGSNRFPDEQT